MSNLGRFSCLLLLICCTGCLHKTGLLNPKVPTPLDNSYSQTSFNTDLKIYTDAINSSATDAAISRAARDRMAYGIMADIEVFYGEYTQSLYSGKGAEAVGMDSLVLGLSTAATIATHTPTKTILSALSTGINGVSLSIDKNFFAQSTFQVISIAMQTRRDKIRAVILSNLASSDSKTYPWELAKRDLVAYFNAGTIAGGLQELQETAGRAASESPTVVDSQKTGTPPPTTPITPSTTPPPSSPKVTPRIGGIAPLSTPH